MIAFEIGPDADQRLQDRLDRVRRDPTSIRTVFPALAREVARDDAVRAVFTHGHQDR